MNKILFYLLLMFCAWAVTINCQTYTYTKGEECSTGHTCPTECVNYPGNFFCACRLTHLKQDLTWKQNFTDCSLNYSPFGVHPFENGKAVDSPQYDYEKLPPNAFSSNAIIYQGFLPRYARLRANEGRKGAWCAPGDDTQNYLTLDLGNVSTVSAVATQGRTGVTIVFSVKTFKLAWAVVNTTFNYFKDSNGNDKIFEGNEDQETIVYNFITPHVKARYLRFLPEEFNSLKCMRVGALGQRNVNECENGWNQCDKLAKCTDTIDSYLCTCPTGYRDELGSGFFCRQINECIERRPEWKHNCSALATCTDKPGYFECKCNEGMFVCLFFKRSNCVHFIFTWSVFISSKQNLKLPYKNLCPPLLACSFSSLGWLFLSMNLKHPLSATFTVCKTTVVHFQS